MKLPYNFIRNGNLNDINKSSSSSNLFNKQLNGKLQIKILEDKVKDLENESLLIQSLKQNILNNNQPIYLQSLSRNRSNSLPFQFNFFPTTRGEKIYDYENKLLKQVNNYNKLQINKDTNNDYINIKSSSLPVSPSRRINNSSENIWENQNVQKQDLSDYNFLPNLKYNNMLNYYNEDKYNNLRYLNNNNQYNQEKNNHDNILINSGEQRREKGNIFKINNNQQNNNSKSTGSHDILCHKLCKKSSFRGKDGSSKLNLNEVKPKIKFSPSPRVHFMIDPQNNNLNLDKNINKYMDNIQAIISNKPPSLENHKKNYAPIEMKIQKIMENNKMNKISYLPSINYIPSNNNNKSMDDLGEGNNKNKENVYNKRKHNLELYDSDVMNDLFSNKNYLTPNHNSLKELNYKNKIINDDYQDINTRKLSNEIPNREPPRRLRSIKSFRNLQLNPLFQNNVHTSLINSPSAKFLKPFINSPQNELNKHISSSSELYNNIPLQKAKSSINIETPIPLNISQNFSNAGGSGSNVNEKKNINNLHVNEPKEDENNEEEDTYKGYKKRKNGKISSKSEKKDKPQKQNDL